MKIQKKLSTDDLFFKYTKLANGKSNLEVFVRYEHLGLDELDYMKPAVVILLQAIIGEYNSMTKISDVSIYPYRESTLNVYLPISDLNSVLGE